MMVPLIDYNGEKVGEVAIKGHAILYPVFPSHPRKLDVTKPHREDMVARVFKWSNGTYRETYWEVNPCMCKNGYY
jgi:hypothetical protein